MTPCVSAFWKVHSLIPPFFPLHVKFLFIYMGCPKGISTEQKLSEKPNDKQGEKSQRNEDLRTKQRNKKK